jgi:hypothetical protein
MFGEFFYNEHIKRCVAVFGTLFNNLEIRKRDASGKVLSAMKVPIAYGPRAKFLSRIEGDTNLRDPKLALKLPRMSFEITSLDYAPEFILQKHNKRTTQISSTTRSTVNEPIKYRIGFQLNIYSKNQDDVLQILEQILPNFKPEYTVAVKETANNFVSDMPFSLKSVSISDEYEGDYLTRRSLIYTIDFESYINFYGPITTSKIIKKAIVDIADKDRTEKDAPFETIVVQVNPLSAGPNDVHTKDITIQSFVSPDFVIIDYTVLNGTLQNNETVVGLTSGTVGRITSLNNDGTITISFPDGQFDVNETIRGDKSNATINVNGVDNRWQTVT